MDAEHVENFVNSGARIRREPGHVSHVSFDHLFFREEGKYSPAGGAFDLRQTLPGLEGCREAICAQDVVIDSDMSLSEAFRALSPDCPDEILAAQEVVGEFYFGEDNKLHFGQVVLHEALVHEVRLLFRELRKHQIPVHSMVPLAEERFHVDGSWDDGKSMELNNSSAFNYRRMLTPTGEKKRLSLHALGLALDINPVWNPCFGDPAVHDEEYHGKECAAGYEKMLPENGAYDPTNKGTFHDRHHVVVLMESMGWTWGGRWGEPKDYHHFQKIPDDIKDWVAAVR